MKPPRFNDFYGKAAMDKMEVIQHIERYCPVIGENTTMELVFSPESVPTQRCVNYSICHKQHGGCRHPSSELCAGERSRPYWK